MVVATVALASNAAALGIGLASAQDKGAPPKDQWQHQQVRGVDNSSGGCFRCCGKGHMARDCPISRTKA